MNAGAEPKPEQGTVAAALRFWLPVIVMVLVVRSFLFQPFHIPSGSMMATLLIGDSLFVSKFSYGYSRYSLPFSPPLFSGRILASLPRRRDVAVFRSPRDDSTDSRVLDEVGYVPFENIVGRAEIIYFSIGDGAAAWQVWRWPTALRLRRFFSIIR